MGSPQLSAFATFALLGCGGHGAKGIVQASFQVRS